MCVYVSRLNYPLLLIIRDTHDAFIIIIQDFGNLHIYADGIKENVFLWTWTPLVFVSQPHALTPYN